MQIHIETLFKDEFGYKVTCKIGNEYYVHRWQDNSSYQYLFNDSKWIEFLGIAKQEYINKLKEYGALNYCSTESPSIYFKTQEEANKAIENFFEPMIMVQKMIA